ncbi:MAG: hypothetical protein QM723_22435 [Myxococcaceae bacterium]
MAEIIDLALLSDARHYLHKLLDTRGLAYFLRPDPKRPYELSPERVNLVLRVAAKKPGRSGKPHQKAVEHARTEIRRELIRRVVAEMVQTGF